MLETAINNVAVKLSGMVNIFTFATLVPEMLVCGSAFVFLMGGVFAADRRTDRALLGTGLFALLSLIAIMILLPITMPRQVLFFGMFVDDGFSRLVKIVLVASTALVFMISDSWLVKDNNQRFEYNVLMLFSLLGMMLMVSANDLLSLYVGLELSSLPLYVLASFSRDSLKSTEAGLKYFVLGSLASGMILFGASLVYGFAGSTNFTALTRLFHASGHLPLAVLFGLVLVIVGLCFKVSAAPFHMWTPDVYEGAPTPVTAFFSTAPKIAAVMLFVRLLIQPFGHAVHDWQQVVVFVSALSMIVGALGALMQSNIKRLLAYSSIGHVGYALMGLAAGNASGISSILIYFILYVAMSIGAFAVVLMMQRDGEAKEAIADLAGLARTHPRMAFGLAVFMFSMAGIPPLAGFFGKLYVFLAAIHAGLYPLAIIGVLSSVVACFYYLKIVKVMYFDEPEKPFDANIPGVLSLVMWACAAFIVLFCILPTPLVSLAAAASEALFQ